MHPWERVARIMVLQHNLIATWQSEAAGVSRQSLARRVAVQGWPRYFRGVTGLPSGAHPLRLPAAAVLAYARPTGGALRIGAPDHEDEFVEQVVHAALAAGHALSGRSGAWMHGFAQAPNVHEVWVPWDSGRVTRAGVRLRYGGNPAGGIQMINGLPVLDPVGCVLETARTPIGTLDQRVDEVIWQMARADSRRLLTVDTVAQRLGELGSCSGLAVMERAIAKVSGTLSHSRPEGRGRELITEALAPLGLVPEPRPFTVRHQGRRIAEADIAIVCLKLDYEVDGPHHRFIDQQMKDQQRDRLLRRATWEVERFSDELVNNHPKVFMARARATAEARMDALSVSPASADGFESVRM